MSNYRDEREALAAENEALRQEKKQLEGQLNSALQGHPVVPPLAANRAPMMIATMLGVMMLGGVGSTVFLLRSNGPTPQPVAVSVRQPVAAPPPPLLILMQTNGNVVFNGRYTATADFDTPLRAIAASQNAAETRVQIAADNSVNAGRVAVVMSAARAAGFTHIAMLAQPTQ